MIDIDTIVKCGILCLWSAWNIHNLTTSMPQAFHVAISRGRKVRVPAFPQIEIHHYTENNPQCRCNENEHWRFHHQCIWCGKERLRCREIHEQNRHWCMFRDNQQLSWASDAYRIRQKMTLLRSNYRSTVFYVTAGIVCHVHASKPAFTSSVILKKQGRTLIQTLLFYQLGACLSLPWKSNRKGKNNYLISKYKLEMLITFFAGQTCLPVDKAW